MTLGGVPLSVPFVGAGATTTYRSGPGWFKGGHNDWTANLVVCLVGRQRCVVMLANDVRAERIYPEITRLALGENDMPWRWEYGWPGNAPPGP